MGGDRGPCNRWSTIRQTDRRRDPLQWTTTARAVQKALGMLEAVAHLGPGTTAKEIATFAGVPSATAYRMLNLLVAEGFLVRVPDLSGFALGRRTAGALACGVVEWSGADAARTRRGHADTHEVRIARRLIRWWALEVRRQGSGSRDHRNSGTGQEPSRECAGEGSVGARRAAAFGFGTSPGHGVHPR